MRVFISGQASAMARGKGCNLEEIASRISTAARGWDVPYFDPVPPYWKRREGNLRVIGKLRETDNQKSFYILKIFNRDDPEYLTFIKNPRVCGEEILEPILSRQNEMVEVSSSDKSPSPVKDKPLPESLKNWLSPPWIEQEGNVVIYESPEWVESFKRENVKKWWESICCIVCKLAEELSTRNFEKPAELSYRDNEKQIGVTAWGFSFDESFNGNNVKKKGLFLIRPHVSREDWAYNRGIPEEPPANGNEILRYALRAYPDYILADCELWDTIQEAGIEANLSLSVEEKRLLDKVVSRGKFPLFINGRAGSGKSTMLMYLFAGYLNKKYSEKLEGNPIFITYSENLVRNARKCVESLLESSFRFTSDGQSDVSINSLDPYFKPLTDLLLELLPPQEKKTFLGKPSGHINFHQFKQMYLNKIKNTRWSPELAWYVINNFIKGYVDEGFLTPEEYKVEVHQKDKTISHGVYKNIFESVWLHWYRGLTGDGGQHWDNQDLVRAVLVQPELPRKFAVIFCDEAQDFTRNELKLIMRLSQFSGYDLSKVGIPCLPFAFAGDPFQTLNPTGFRWESVKASLYEQIIVRMGPMDGSRIEMNYEELEYNYRSTTPIVRFSNTIQAMRKILFSRGNLRPQPTWRKEKDAPQPLRFVVDEIVDGQNLDNLVEVLNNTIILIPVEEGGEWDFIEGDMLLQKIVSRKRNGVNPPKNIMSPMAAKGLEFTKVVLYKFGETLNRDLSTLFNDFPISELEIEHFFNKLYVASTRATRSLFVLDTRKGNKHLGKHLGDKKFISQILQKMEQDPWPEDSLLVLEKGKRENIEEMRETEPGLIANQLERTGGQSQNPEIMRRAMLYWKEAGELNKARKCEAFALKFEGQFEKAGKEFERLNRANDAWLCYWKGCNWENIWEWGKKYKSHSTLTSQQELSLHMAKFMCGDETNRDLLRNFLEVLEEKIKDDDIDFNAPFSPQWTEVIQKMQERLNTIVNNIENPGSYVKLLRALENAGFDVDRVLIGKLYMKDGKYQEAIEFFKKAGYKEREFQLALAEQELSEGKLLNALERLLKLEEYDRVIKEGQNSNDPETLLLVSRAYFSTNQYKEALSSLNKAIKAIEDQGQAGALKEYLELMGDCQEELGEFNDAIETYRELGNFQRAIELARKGGWRQNQIRHLEAEEALNNREFHKAAEIFELIGEHSKASLARGYKFRSEDRIGEALEEFIGAGQWSEIWNCINELDKLPDLEQRERYLLKFLKAIVDIDHQFSRHEIDRILEWVKEIQDAEKWEAVITPQEMGSIYEKLSAFRDTAIFYRSYFDSHEWARKGWLRTKEKQMKYHLAKDNEIDKEIGKKIESEIRRKKLEWYGQ